MKLKLSIFIIIIVLLFPLFSYSEVATLNLTIGEGGDISNIEMGYPVCLTSDGIYVYITDWEKSKIFLLSRSGKFIKSFPLKSDNYKITKPVGIAIGPKGNLFIVSQGENKVIVVSRKGKLLKTFGNKLLDSPRGITIDKTGNVYVVDTNHNRVVKFDRDGKLLFSFGREGGGKGEFYYPRGIGINSKDYLYVADTFHSKVQVFTLNGKYVGEFGKPGTGKGEFRKTRYLAFDKRNNIYISDYNNGRIQVFSKEGKFLYSIGKNILLNPEGVMLDGNYLWVCDSGNNRIVRFKLKYISSLKNKAMAKFKEGKWQESLILFKKAVRENPSDLELHKYLALAYAKLDKWEDAQKEYEFLFSKGVKDVKDDLTTSLYSLALSYCEENKYRKALNVLNRLKSIDPKNKEINKFYREVKLKSMLELILSFKYYILALVILIIIFYFTSILKTRRKGHSKRIYRR